MNRKTLRSRHGLKQLKTGICPTLNPYSAMCFKYNPVGKITYIIFPQTGTNFNKQCDFSYSHIGLSLQFTAITAAHFSTHRKYDPLRLSFLLGLSVYLSVRLSLSLSVTLNRGRSLTVLPAASLYVGFMCKVTHVLYIYLWDTFLSQIK